MNQILREMVVIIFYGGSSLPLDSYISEYLSLLFLNDVGIPLRKYQHKSE